MKLYAKICLIALLCMSLIIYKTNTVSFIINLINGSHQAVVSQEIDFKNQVLVFDFDGTIADSIDPLVETINQVGKEWRIKATITKEDIKTKDLRALLRKHIWWFQGLSIRQRILELTEEKMASIKPFTDIKETLTQLKRQGCRLNILTSNTKENVNAFLKQHGMEDLFDVVYGKASIFGKHVVMKKFLRNFKLAPEEVIYVGDEIRDIEAARKVGMHIISVTWGFNYKNRLTTYNPDALVDKPPALLQAVLTVQGNAQAQTQIA